MPAVPANIRLQLRRFIDVRFMLHGSGPPVLFLHGIPTGPRLWDHVVRILSPNFTCIVADLTEMAEPVADAYAVELETLRAELRYSSWAVVGHDAGCVLGVHYAARFPAQVSALVLCSAPLFPDHQVPWFFQLVRTPAIGQVFARPVLQAAWIVLRRSLGRFDTRNEEIVESFERQFHGREGARRFGRLLRWGNPHDVLGTTASLLPQITSATLLMHGIGDRAIPPTFAERAASAIPKATYRFLECDHFVPLECPNSLSEAVLTFLAQTVTCDGRTPIKPMLP